MITILRLIAFFFVFLSLSLAEFFFPRKNQYHFFSERWLSNIGITVTNSIMLAVLPFSAALFAEKFNFGLFTLLNLQGTAHIIAAILLLDLVIYWQHRLFHTVPWLWHLHKMHHTDRALDVTSALRFHPLEILLSQAIKVAAVIVFGINVEAVIIFEILLNATAMFNHANFRLPVAVDNILRLVLVTPDMHRVHHSETEKETNSNYGFNLPWWDHLFKSYRHEPELGRDGVILGLSEYREAKQTSSYLGLLALPFLHLFK